MIEMRILTVRQPWAWAIIHGGKNVENRVRNIAGSYRGPIAIHTAVSATATLTAADERLVLDHDVDGKVDGWMDGEPIEGGAIIGVVDLVDVHMAAPDDLGAIRCQPENRAPGPWRSACSPWAQEANYHLELANPRALTSPIPYKGAPGFRRLDDTTIAQILAQTGEKP